MASPARGPHAAIQIASTGSQGLVKLEASAVVGAGSPGVTAGAAVPVEPGAQAAGNPALPAAPERHQAAQQWRNLPEVPFASIKRLQLLGQSDCVRVYKAEVPGYGICTVKVQCWLLMTMDHGPMRHGHDAVAMVQLEGYLRPQSSHPNVVPCYAIVSSGDLKFGIVTEYVAGGTLEEYVRSNGPLPLA